MTGGQSQLETVETTTTLTRQPPTTVVSSDVDVANGFVKNGSSLPYIIETNKLGEKFIKLELSMAYFKILIYRQQKTFFQNFTSMWHLWKKIRMCHHNEETFGDSHWGKTFQLQSLWKTIHSKRKSSGKFDLLYNFQPIFVAHFVLAEFLHLT